MEENESKLHPVQPNQALANPPSTNDDDDDDDSNTFQKMKEAMNSSVDEDEFGEDLLGMPFEITDKKPTQFVLTLNVTEFTKVWCLAASPERMLSAGEVKELSKMELANPKQRRLRE